MNKKFFVIIIILFVFGCLSAVNANEIDNVSVSTSDISVSDCGGDVGSNEVDYVGGINEDLDDSNNSQLLGVCEDDDLIQDGQKRDVEFRGIPKKVFLLLVRVIHGRKHLRLVIMVGLLTFRLRIQLLLIFMIMEWYQ